MRCKTEFSLQSNRPYSKPIFAALMLVASQVPLDALADTYSFTQASSTDVTYAPVIYSGVNTNLTAYSSSFHWIYTLEPFTVDTTGDYTISSTTTGVVNTMFVLSGTFAPTSTFPPSTPIEQFIASNFNGSNTSLLSDMTFIEGEQYSVLVAYNQTTAGTYPYTVTITFDGPGCVQVYDNVCVSASVPVVVTDAQVAEEMTLQAAQQGMVLSDMQSRSTIGQMRQRMQGGFADRRSTGSVALSYAEEAKNDRAAIFNLVAPDLKNDTRWTAWADTGADGLRGNWNPDVRGYQVSQQFGLDYRFANGWVGGASVGASVFGNDFDNGGELSGSAYWISPYLGMQFDGWLVTLQAAYTYADYDKYSSGTGIDGDTTGQRLSGSLSVAREVDLGGSLYAIPEVTLSAGREKIADISELGSASVNDPRFFSVRAGGELGYEFAVDSRVYGLAFAEYADTNADASASYLSTGYKADVWSATLGGGVDAMLTERTKVSLEGRVRGIGSDTIIYGGNARLSLRF